MPEFYYIAVNNEKEIKRDLIYAASIDELKNKLSAKGWELISCEEQKKEKINWNLDIGELIKRFYHSRSSVIEKIYFAQHLAVMLKAGVPVLEAVEALISSNTSFELKKIIHNLSLSLEEGNPLSAVLEKTNFFSQAHLAILKAGEASGKVSESLNLIASDLKRSYYLQKKVKGAMAYPLIIVFALLIISGFVIIFVLPKVGEVFKQMNLPLPLPTKILLALGFFLSKNWRLLLFILIFFVISFLFFLKKSIKLQKFFKKTVIRLPLIKGIIKQLEMVHFVRSLSSLLSAGVSISESLTISAKVFINPKAQEIIQKISQQVKKGVSLTACFSQEENFFQSVLVKMTAVGEKSGRLAEILEELALFYEEEVKAKLDNFSTLIEPILMLLVGLGVGLMILSIIGPIYQMMGSLTP